MFVEFKKSNNPKKKLMAIFYDKNKKKIKTTHFGAAGYDDYTITNDEKQKDLYRKRHKKDLKTNDFMRAGYLAYHVLWNKKTLKASIADYMKMFKLKKYY
jgi:beta-lactamase class A